jgi:uncharacterized protein (DUF427 family)
MGKRIDIPITPRLERLAEDWQRSGARRPRVEPAPPGKESVWDYPRPPAVEEVEVRVRVMLGDACVADSRHALRVLETSSPPTVYLPPGDADRALLLPDEGASFCEWKGTAHYVRVEAGGRVSRQAGWSYPEPFPEYAVLAGYLSFYPARVECFYGDHRAEPQPGRFYGGWVTPGLVGPFKGAPGSSGW